MPSNSVAVPLLVTLLLICSGSAVAGESDGDGGLTHQSDLQVRATPVGVSLFSDTGYRWPIDVGDGPLFDGTGVETGLATSLSPAYGWAGPYVEILPIAVLNLRASVQWMHYWGAFGHLYIPADDGEGQTGGWSDENLDRAWDEGLGQSASGWKLHLEATPQMLIDRWAIQIPTEYHRIDMGVDAPYYEPYLDVLMAPTEHLWITSPTVGYVLGENPEESFVLVGLRWERLVATQADVTKDTVGLVWNWQLPEAVISTAETSLSGFAGAFIDHPTRGSVAPYLGLELSIGF